MSNKGMKHYAHPGDVSGAIGARISRKSIGLHLHSTRDSSLVNLITGLLPGLNLAKLVAAVEPMEEALGRPLPGHVYQAWRRSPQISAMFQR